MTTKLQHEITQEEAKIQTPKTVIKGDFRRPRKPKGVIIFAHGAGSSRLSPRNKRVAEILQQADFATLLMDLLSEEEDQLDIFTRKLRFDIPLLAGRVDSATEWILRNESTSHLPIGYFGASTGAAAALVASIQRPETIRAIVCRGGRPDLVSNILSEVKPPTMLIVGSDDTAVLEKNQMALTKINAEKKLAVVGGASHLFEEPGKLDEVAKHARSWFQRFLASGESGNSTEFSRPHIDSYSFGRMTVNGTEYDKDLIIFPERISDHWWRSNGHILRMDDLEEVVEYKPELLIVGTGSSGQMQVAASTKDGLRQEGIKLTEAQSAEAVRLFNREIQKGTNVVGAFHLTC
jgi:dienelactone hydrolase